jgi:hypothetical protein
MSQPNYITVWLRPASAVKPYIITECAKWLVCRGIFRTYDYARKYLEKQEKYNPLMFKNYISLYYEAHDRRQTRQPINKNINELYSSTDPFGTEIQQWTKSNQLK